MFYYANWMALVAISLWIAFIAFLWALRSGQFSEQDRARYLPLCGEDLWRPPESAKNFLVHKYALLAILIVGILLCLAPLGMGLTYFLRSSPP